MRAYYCLYYNIVDDTESLSPAEFGNLVRSLVYYARYGKEDPEMKLSKYGRFSYKHFFRQADRDNEKYRRICERNRKNGMKGGRPRKASEEEETERVN